MRHIDPVVVETFPRGQVGLSTAPRACAGARREIFRFEWRFTDGGDPAALVEDVLARHELPVHELTRIGGPHDGHRVCGAAVYLSAAAGAAMIGAPAGPVSPVRSLPDVAVIGYAHEPEPAAGAARPDVKGWPDAPAWRLGPWRESWDPARHAAAVESVRAAIAAGDVYQVNLVGHAAARYRGDPLPALRRVAALPGARYAGVLAGAGWAIGCASPETLIDVRDGRAVTRPIKGTRPATEQGRRELLDSAKERAEHIMIVDLERNDLGHVARTGSVRVDELYAVRRWCGLWQAESTVSAELADGVGLAALLRAICPGGSVTGAPKLAALDRIAALEPIGRGASMGALGWIGADRIELGLSIRTAAVDADRVHVWAGGGITWSSEPDAEVAEAAAKAAPVRAALAGRSLPAGAR